MASNSLLISVFGYIRGFRGKNEKILDLIRNQKVSGSTPLIGFFQNQDHQYIFIFYKAKF